MIWGTRISGNQNIDRALPGHRYGPRFFNCKMLQDKTRRAQKGFCPLMAFASKILCLNLPHWGLHHRYGISFHHSSGCNVWASLNTRFLGRNTPGPGYRIKTDEAPCNHFTTILSDDVNVRKNHQAPIINQQASINNHKKHSIVNHKSWINHQSTSVKIINHQSLSIIINQHQ